MVGAAASGISGLPLAFASNKATIYLLGLCISYLAGFLAAWVIGFEDLPEPSRRKPVENDPGKGL